MSLKVALSLILTLILTQGSAAAPAVGLNLNATVGQAPFEAITKITVEADYLARELCINWDSLDGEAGGSCWPHEGQYAPHTTFFTLHLGTPGTYQVQVYLVRVRDVVKSYPITVLVK